MLQRTYQTQKQSLDIIIQWSLRCRIRCFQRSEIYRTGQNWAYNLLNYRQCRDCLQGSRSPNTRSGGQLDHYKQHLLERQQQGNKKPIIYIGDIAARYNSVAVMFSGLQRSIVQMNAIKQRLVIEDQKGSQIFFPLYIYRYRISKSCAI